MGAGSVFPSIPFGSRREGDRETTDGNRHPPLFDVCKASSTCAPVRTYSRISQVPHECKSSLDPLLGQVVTGCLYLTLGVCSKI